MDDRQPAATDQPVETISIVLPVPQFDRQVLSTVDRYRETAEELGVALELIVVTPVVKQAQKVPAGAAIRILELVDWSWGRAVRRGLAQAKGDVLGYTNLNRTSAETLALMLAYTLSYRGVVLKANRRTRDSVAQRLGSLLFNAECWKLLDLASWDINGTPKMFPRACSRLLELRRDDDLIDAEFMLVCQDENYPLLEIPTSAVPQRRDWPRTSLRQALRMYVGAFQLWRERRQE